MANGAENRSASSWIAHSKAASSRAGRNWSLSFNYGCVLVLWQGASLLGHDVRREVDGCFLPSQDNSADTHPKTGNDHSKGLVLLSPLVNFLSAASEGKAFCAKRNNAGWLPAKSNPVE